MIIHSDLPKKAYIKAIKERRESPFRFGSERFCGAFLGGLFCVTYHCSTDWNQRITGERNTAIGIIKKDGDGCQIRCFTVKGLLAPHYLLVLFLFFLICSVSVVSRDQISVLSHIYATLISLAASVLMGIGTAIAESFTEQSAQGKRILCSILLDPTDLFSYMNNIKEIR